jgi:sugar phosphate isomerase/epimerase
VKLGFITSCLPELALEDVVGWASEHGHRALEVAAWPRRADRPFTASHIDVAGLDSDATAQIRSLFTRHNVELCSVTYYDNNLHPHPETRQEINHHLSLCLDAAAAVGSPTVGTFVGRDSNRSVRENLAKAARVFQPLVEGEVDWRRLIDTMYEYGFDGVLSVEHEDPLWGGTPDKVKQGLDIAHRNLTPFLVD